MRLFPFILALAILPACGDKEVEIKQRIGDRMKNELAEKGLQPWRSGIHSGLQGRERAGAFRGGNEHGKFQALR